MPACRRCGKPYTRGEDPNYCDVCLEFKEHLRREMRDPKPTTRHCPGCGRFYQGFHFHRTRTDWQEERERVREKARRPHPPKTAPA